MIMAKPDSTKLILVGNALVICKFTKIFCQLWARSDSLWRSNLCILLCPILSLYPGWDIQSSGHECSQCFSLRCLQRVKYSEVVMLLRYPFVPWNTDQLLVEEATMMGVSWLIPHQHCLCLSPCHTTMKETPYPQFIAWEMTLTSGHHGMVTLLHCFHSLPSLIHHQHTASLVIAYDYGLFLAPIIFLINTVVCKDGLQC